MKTNFKTFLEDEHVVKSIEQFAHAALKHIRGDRNKDFITYKGDKYYPSGPFNQGFGGLCKAVFWKTRKTYSGPGIEDDYVYREIVLDYLKTSTKPCAALEWKEDDFVGHLLIPIEYAQCVLNILPSEKNKDNVIKQILVLYREAINHDEDTDIAKEWQYTREGLKFLLMALKDSGLKWPELDQIEKSLK